jgi:hypothetical protein
MEEFLTALAHDVAGAYELAVAAYERAILRPQAPVEAFANLSFIYWESITQQSMTFTNGTAIPLTLNDMPWQTCFRVLAKGFQRYPNDLELSFWKRYYPYRGIFDDFSDADCQQLLVDCVDHNQTLMPYFFLSLFDEVRHSDDVARILSAYDRSPTAKNLWVASVLNARIYER